MANEQTKFNTRIQQKHDIETNWLKATGFIPKEGEIIVYDADDAHQYPRIKIGNGADNVNALSFIGTSANWAQNDAAQPDYIKNRTHWVEAGAEIPIQGMWAESEGLFAFTAPLGLELGKAYVVTWDGVEYACTAHNAVYNDIPCICLGNSALFFGTGDTGELFALAEFPAEAVASIGAYGVAGATDFTLNHEFFIKKGIVHKLDPQFYDRIAWVEGGIENLPETTFELIDSMDLLGASIYTPLSLVLGETYVVVLNGEEYTCTASKIEDANGIILMDSPNLESFNTFGIIELYQPLQDSVTGETVYAFINFKEHSDTSQQFTLRIYQLENIHKIDPKFLPDDIALKSDIEAYINEAILGGAW